MPSDSKERITEESKHFIIERTILKSVPADEKKEVEFVLFDDQIAKSKSNQDSRDQQHSLKKQRIAAHHESPHLLISPILTEDSMNLYIKPNDVIGAQTTCDHGNFGFECNACNDDALDVLLQFATSPVQSSITQSTPSVTHSDDNIISSTLLTLSPDIQVNNTQEASIERPVDHPLLLPNSKDNGLKILYRATKADQESEKTSMAKPSLDSITLTTKSGSCSKLATMSPPRNLIDTSVTTSLDPSLDSRKQYHNQDSRMIQTNHDSRMIQTNHDSRMIQANPLHPTVYYNNYEYSQYYPQYEYGCYPTSSHYPGQNLYVPSNSPSVSYYVSDLGRTTYPNHHIYPGPYPYPVYGSSLSTVNPENERKRKYDETSGYGRSEPFYPYWYSSYY